MKPLFFGYLLLYLHMEITPIASLDPYVYSSTEESLRNCTHCNFKPDTTCQCEEDSAGNGCTICCPKNEKCCFCSDCSVCWTRRLARARCFRAQQELDGTTHCSTEDSRERPPPYSQVCGAPPLYTSPYNRASMQDAPPRYPDTPKLQERCRCVRDPTVPFVPYATQHM